MKLLRIIVIAFSLLIVTNTESSAVHINLNSTITSAGPHPCTFRVTGWIEVGILSGTLQHCDVTVSGPCGSWHFVQRMLNPSTLLPVDENDELPNPIIKQYLYDENNNPVPLDTIDLVDLVHQLTELGRS